MDAIEGEDRRDSDKEFAPIEGLMREIVGLIDIENPLSKTAFLDNAVNQLHGGKLRKKDVRIAFECAETADTIPGIVVDHLTEEQEKALRIADNKTAEVAEWNGEIGSEEAPEDWSSDCYALQV